MNKEQLLQIVDPVASVSSLYKYQLPWVWIIGEQNQVRTIFSDGGGIIAQCDISMPCENFAYKVNGVMLQKAIETMPKKEELVFSANGTKLQIKAGKVKSELPNYPIDSDPPGVITPGVEPNVKVDCDIMKRLIKLARVMQTNICFREDGNAGCYCRTQTYSSKVQISNSEVLIPQRVVSVLDYLGEEITLHVVNEEYAILSTGNMIIKYKHDRYIDHKLDKRLRLDSKIPVGQMKTPSFSNFKKCGADLLAWDSNDKIVKQYNVSELMYSEEIDGTLSESFLSSLIPELGPEFLLFKATSWPIYVFDFGQYGQYGSCAIREA